MSFSSIIVNSIPKSGTYLLATLIDALGVYPQVPDMHINDPHYSYGVDKKSALKIRKVAVPKSFSVIPEAHSCPAHFVWSQAAEDALKARNIGMFLMYRDPRDIVISYAKFAMYSEIYRHQTKSHKHYHQLLSKLPNDQRRAEHVLTHRLNLFQFHEHAPWLFSPACMPVAFETLYQDVLALAGGKVGATITSILAYLGIKQLSITPEELFTRVHGQGKTAMAGSDKIEVYKTFYDDALHKTAARSDFQAILHMYGYR